MEVKRAEITDEALKALVTAYRDNAGQAARLFKKPGAAKLYRDAQNGFADIYQELLDRRRV